MFTNNLRQRYNFKGWGIPDAPACKVRIVWYSSTDNDRIHQWLRALMQRLFLRPVS